MDLLRNPKEIMFAVKDLLSLTFEETFSPVQMEPPLLIVYLKIFEWGKALQLFLR